MGEGRKLTAGGIALITALALLCVNASASPVPNQNPWLEQQGILNMAHQGGEMEAPSSTMYAFRTALEDRGADSLELDVNATSDGRLAVMHDYYTRRITPLDEQVRDLTFAQIQALDAAWWFSPGYGQFNHSLPDDLYPLRGVRTGAKPPPDGFTADDFRIPSIEEVLDAFPGVPINIEIKSVPDESDESIRVATLLAAVMNQPANQNKPVIVASLDQNALETFHDLAPHVGVSASLTSMLGFMGGTPIDPEPVALQVPMLIGSLDPPKELQKLDVESMGYAVHAWTDSLESENDEVYAHLIDSGVQGIISSAPSRLSDYLCRTGERRPDGSPRCEQQIMKYRLSYPSRSLRKFLKQGLPVRASCDQDCDVAFHIRIRSRKAKQLGMKAKPDRRGRVLVGISEAKPQYSAGNSTFRGLAFKGPYRRFARIRQIQVEITSIIIDGRGWRRAVERRWLTLKSPRPLIGKKRK